MIFGVFAFGRPNGNDAIDPQVDDVEVALEQLIFGLVSGEFYERLGDALLGKLDAEAGLIDHVPAPVGDAGQGDETVLQLRDVAEGTDHDEGIVGSAIADDERQIAIGAAIFADLCAGRIDHEGDAVDAPARDGHVFGYGNRDISRIGLADGDGVDGRKLGDALARRLDVEGQR